MSRVVDTAGPWLRLRARRRRRSHPGARPCAGPSCASSHGPVDGGRESFRITAVLGERPHKLRELAGLPAHPGRVQQSRTSHRATTLLYEIRRLAGHAARAFRAMLWRLVKRVSSCSTACAAEAGSAAAAAAAASPPASSADQVAPQACRWRSSASAAAAARSCSSAPSPPPALRAGHHTKRARMLLWPASAGALRPGGGPMPGWSCPMSARLRCAGGTSPHPTQNHSGDP